MIHDTPVPDIISAGLSALSHGTTRCTGLHQPCDVGIQRPFKHSIKCSYHESVITEMLEKIEKDSPVLTVNKSIVTLP